MGVIRIEVDGSFDPHDKKTFTAMNGGHAGAVAAAIAYLSGDVLPAAIRRDHALHEVRELPPEGEFGDLGKEV